MLEQEYAFYLADTDAGKSIHYALRYQVYCLREKYEDPARHPNFCEQDEFDDSSVHFIARSVRTGEWLGAMRLIIGPVQNLPVPKLPSSIRQIFPTTAGRISPKRPGSAPFSPATCAPASRQIPGKAAVPAPAPPRR